MHIEPNPLTTLRGRLLLATLLTGLLAALVGRPATAADTENARAHKLVAQSLAALGAGRDLRETRSLTATVRQVTYHLADGDHPDAPYAADFGEANITLDLATGRVITTVKQSLATQESVTATTLATPELQRMTVAANGQPLQSRVVAPEPDFDLAEPLMALRMAYANKDLRLGPPTLLHGVRADVVRFQHRGFPVRLLLGTDSHLPLALEARMVMPSNIVWNARGDLTDRFDWMNWTLASGVRYPYQWDHFRNGDLLRTTSVTALAVDQPLDAATTLTPDDLKALDEPGRRNVDELPLGRPDRPITEIAPGVVQIPGSWYTTLVRQADGVVVIDAPISDGYSRQVLAEAARRFPGLPVKALITTTGFGWHIAGIREYAAREIPIYVLDSNAALVRARLTAPHTLAPDALAKHPVPLHLRRVSGPLRVGQGATGLVVYPIRGATSQMLMVHLPQPQILHTAEMVQPLGPNGAFLFPESLLELQQAVQQAGLSVKTMIGMHMSATPWSALDASIAATLKPLAAP